MSVRVTVPTGVRHSKWSDLHLGGFVGYSAWGCAVNVSRHGRQWGLPEDRGHRGHRRGIPSGNDTTSLNRPPSQMVFSLPGMPHSHDLRSSTPWGVFWGRA